MIDFIGKFGILGLFFDLANEASRPSAGNWVKTSTHTMGYKVAGLAIDRMKTGLKRPVTVFEDIPFLGLAIDRMKTGLKHNLLRRVEPHRRCGLAIDRMKTGLKLIVQVVLHLQDVHGLAIDRMKTGLKPGGVILPLRPSQEYKELGDD